MQVTLEQGQVCFAIVKMVVRKEGIRNFGKDAIREIGNVAKAIGFPPDEVAPIISAAIAELAEETCTALSTVR